LAQQKLQHYSWKNSTSDLKPSDFPLVTIGTYWGMGSAVCYLLASLALLLDPVPGYADAVGKNPSFCKTLAV